MKSRNDFWARRNRQLLIVHHRLSGSGLRVDRAGAGSQMPALPSGRPRWLEPWKALRRSQRRLRRYQLRPNRTKPCGINADVAIGERHAVSRQEGCASRWFLPGFCYSLSGRRNSLEEDASQESIARGAQQDRRGASWNLKRARRLRHLSFAGRLGCRKEGTEDRRCHSGARAVLSALLRGGLPCGRVGIPVLKSSNPELFRRSCRSSTVRRRAALSCSK